MTNETIYQSKKCGPFRVLDKTDGVCTIRFEDTGTITKVGYQWVRVGSCNDPYAKTVSGIGFIGEGPYRSVMKDEDGKSAKSPAYKLWVNMLARCYIDPANGKRPTYQTCTVHKDWHNFQTFCNDIKQLDGYGLWLAYHSGMGGEKIELDKDILCSGMEAKEYGPSTCQFVTKSDNLKAMWAVRREVQA
ncbi:hypothetical protein [Aeromonas phage Asp37]|nr:hypothetical protein [Aeromonas phage Asp37]